jgi:mRNA interferase RelE/StbE
VPRNVILARRALREFDLLPTADQQRLRDALHTLERDPALVDFKKLGGGQDLWRLRVGRWRAIIRYDTTSGLLMVERVLARDRAYRD